MFTNISFVNCQQNGDDNLVENKNKNIDYIFIFVINNINIDDNIIFITDSVELDCLLKTNKYYITNTKKTHIGHPDSKLEDVQDTLCDFFIISRSKKIIQFSVHCWGSGFSQLVSTLYNIPIINITINL